MNAPSRPAGSDSALAFISVVFREAGAQALAAVFLAAVFLAAVFFAAVFFAAVVFTGDFWAAAAVAVVAFGVAFTGVVSHASTNCSANLRFLAISLPAKSKYSLT